MDNNVLQQLLFLNKIPPWPWELMGVSVVYDTFPVGTEEACYESLSAELSSDAREKKLRIKLVANALRSVGGYDFKTSLSEKESFLRGLQPTVFSIFLEKYIQLRAFQSEEFSKLQDQTKKLPANPSPAQGGNSSEEAPK